MKEESNTEKLNIALLNEGDQIVERLVNSFSDLEMAIESARANFSKLDNIPEEVVARLDSYFSIIAKQRSLTSSLKELVVSGNVAEVARHINLINGLSSMIIDDAKGILSGLHDDESISVEDEISCC